MEYQKVEGTYHPCPYRGKNYVNVLCRLYSTLWSYVTLFMFTAL